MLVLSRKIDDSIMLGENIEIKILSIDNDTIRIGIDAPQSIVILRKEVYERVTEENKVAMKTSKENIDKLSDLL